MPWLAALTMTGMKSTKRPRVRVSSEREQQALQMFDVELVPLRDGTQNGTRDPGHDLRDDVPFGWSRIIPPVSQVQYQAPTSEAVPPVSWLKAIVRSQRHLESGTFGQSCTLKTNRFIVNLLNNQVHQYDVCISPEVSSCDVNRAVMGVLVSQSHLDGCLPAYDGRKLLYTALPLPFTCRTFEISLEDEEVILGVGDGKAPWSHMRVRLFKVVIKFATCVGLDMDLAVGQEDKTQVLLQVLDVILREIFIGRCYPSAQPLSLGKGLEICQSFYKSLQLTQKGLLLNIDVSSTVSIKPMPIIDYIAHVLDKDLLSEPLCDGDELKITGALEGVMVQFLNMHKKYRVFGLTSQVTKELFVPIDDRGTTKPFIQYFLDTYNLNIEYTALPCLQVGNKRRPVFLPMELCKIAEGQRYSKHLNREQMSALLGVTRLNPRQRELHILQTLNDANYNEVPHAKEFGIKIEKQLLSLKSRVLPPPWLKFHDSSMNKEFLPQVGQWNMIRKKMFNGGRVGNWTCVNFSWDLEANTVRSFCRELAIMCQASGIDFSVDPVLPVVTASPEDVELTLNSCHQNVMNVLGPQGRELDLLVVILPSNKGSLYGDLKRICETDIGLVSQCCLANHVVKTTKQYLANVALKINVKVGGKNTVLLDAFTNRLPCVGDIPTIIFGAHVVHPGKSSGHSIAAVVASQDWPEVTNYAALASAQAHCEEFIQDLFQDQYDCKTGAVPGGMIIQHVISFQRATGRKPQRIIFYRDAVSDRQLYQVMWQELVAIKKACSCLEPDYNPSVTYVVLQKQRHTWFFADEDDDRSLFRSGNVLPGTVVDSNICHPNESGFYLCSQVGTCQGTVRPVHYHILWDENRFTADKFQCLTNYLCYTYARCTHSVLIVPPVYYARLMASRGRLYMQRGASHASTSDGSVEVRCLPAVKENVKRVMFYC